MAKKAPAIAHRGIRLELDGEGVKPGAFDVLSGLAYVSSYLQMLATLAHLRETPVIFKGMKLVPGSVAFEIDTSEPTMARGLAKEATAMLSGKTPVPHGLHSKIRDVHSALARMPEGTVTRVRADGYMARLRAPKDDPEGVVVEATEMRVTVYRVGGNPAKLSVANDVEGGFTLAIKNADATAIAHHLYGEVDIVAYVERNLAGKIFGGKVLKFYPLDTPDENREASVWREWFAKAGSEWDEVEDIEVELERSRDIVHGRH